MRGFSKLGWKSLLPLLLREAHVNMFVRKLKILCLLSSVFLWPISAFSVEPWQFLSQEFPASYQDSRAGYAVDVDGEWMIAGAYANSDVATYAGAAYLYKNSAGNWVKTQKLLPSEDGGQSYSAGSFGISVAIDGDWLAVGAYNQFDSTGASRSGSVYLYERLGESWYFRQKVLPDASANPSLYGYSISMSNGRLAVGSFKEDSTAAVAGAVYIYKIQSGGDWHLEQRVAPDSLATNDLFGLSVDLNGDSMVVSAQNNDEGGVQNAGAAYVYVYSNGVWALDAKLLPSDLQAEGLFGHGIFAGDRVVVGSSADGSYANSGAVYVYEKVNGIWAQAQKLFAEDSVANSRFGLYERSISYNGITLAIGASADNDNGTKSGSVYVYEFDGSQFYLSQKIIASDGAANDEFGVALAQSNQYLVIGSWLQDDAASNTGSIYLYETTIVDSDGDSVPDQSDAFPNDPNETADNDGDGVGDNADLDDDNDNYPDSQDAFPHDSSEWLDTDGDGVGNNADTDDDGDGIPDSQDPQPLVSWMQKVLDPLAVNGWEFGASVDGEGPYFISGGSQGAGTNRPGYAAIFERGLNGEWSKSQHLTASVGEANDEFGYRVQMDGDVVAVSTRPSYPSAKFGQGEVYVFRHDGSQFVEEAILVGSGVETRSDVGFSFYYMGHARALEGDILVASAPGQRNLAGGASAGAVYIYRYSGGQWVEHQTLKGDDFQGDSFGSSLAIQGAKIIVGASGDDERADGAGAVYVFDYDTVSDTWIRAQKLTDPNGGAGDALGSSVAIDGATMISGASYADESHNHSGNVCVFELNNGVWSFSQKVVPSVVDESDDFAGGSVSIFGNTFVVHVNSDEFGTGGSPTVGTNSGSVFVYKKVNGVWIEDDQLLPFDGANRGHLAFGQQLVFDGNFVFMGDVRDQDLELGYNNRGAVYVYQIGTDSDADGYGDSIDNCPNDSNIDQSDADGNGVGDACDSDLDGDGVSNAVDNCPATSNPDQLNTDGDFYGNACDSDDDGDGIDDASDNCPINSNTSQVDQDNDGVGDACDGDIDGDQVTNAVDNCPLESNVDQADHDADDVGDICDSDDDNDGVIDETDNCPLSSNPNQADLDSDGLGDVCDSDDDNDGVDDTNDNCPANANSDQADLDYDSLGDVCDSDVDGDGLENGADNCPTAANSDQSDLDGDGIGTACDSDDDGDGVDDSVDNCPLIANSSQKNSDGDAYGNVCDPDDDNDGINDEADNCPVNSNSDQSNNDGDSEGDVCDHDDDNDNVQDSHDNCPLIANSGQENYDQDSHGDVCDTDDDNDGVDDGSDAFPFDSSEWSDTDNDGFGDNSADNCPTDSNPDQRDTDSDGMGDVCDADDDNDNIPDSIDPEPTQPITDLTDSDGDGYPDDIEIFVGTDPNNPNSKPL